MGQAAYFFRKHPVAISFLILYTLLCIRAISTGFEMAKRMEENSAMSGIQAGGEGLGLTNVFLVEIGSVFFLLCGGYAIAKPKETRFYLVAIAIVIVEAIAVFTIN